MLRFILVFFLASTSVAAMTSYDIGTRSFCVDSFEYQGHRFAATGNTVNGQKDHQARVELIFSTVNQGRTIKHWLSLPSPDLFWDSHFSQVIYTGGEVPVVCATQRRFNQRVFAKRCQVEVDVYHVASSEHCDGDDEVIVDFSFLII